MNIFLKIQQAEKLSVGLKNLYLSKVIRDIGVTLVGMFGPIFVFVISNSWVFVLIYYGLICLLYILLVPLWARFLGKKSMHFFMIIGTLFLIIYYIIFYFLSQANQIIWPLTAILISSALIARLFYWIPYHIDFSRFVNKHHRGRQISFLAIIVSLLGIALPFFSALIIFKFSFSILFLIAIIILIISLFPTFFIPHTREQYSFKYFETFKKLFSKRHFKTNFAYVSDGFQGQVGALIWPIFIFTILKDDYLKVGLISSAIILVACVVRFVTGEATDKFNKNKLIKVGSVLHGVGWFVKAFVFSGLHIFLAGVYHSFTSILMRTPFDVLTYEIAADEGHYIDEFTILREMSLNFGRVLMVLFTLGLILVNANIVWVFIFSAFVSVFVNFISKEEFYLANKSR